MNTWIACSQRYQVTGKPCSARARYLVTGGYDAGRHVCGTHARQYSDRVLQVIEYPR